ncbi:DUF262 domain-containing protein [Terriglobus roseus]|uniref:DUF262 domain-containing protein n=1 Tax=Terriglobus roseus TaxID=392734 RepID=A0A1H4RQ42_9BACT|nr:DUF262 domain-containing protein [Terriglobus roseus]SEC34042.1 Protein of unknown function [Terriglobus roseus]
MPTDQVKNRSFKELLTGTVRFKIPFFQRGYAWEKKQWEQLFLDLQEQVITELDAGSSPLEIQHFFGPVVVMEEAGVPELKEFLVIDGQQRITTVYLLLGIIREHLLTKKHLSVDATDYSKKLMKFISNDIETGDDYLHLKVFSSKGDRLPSYRVLFGTETNPKTPLLQTDLQAFVPGASKVEGFKKYADKKLKNDFPDVPSLWRLAQVLLQCLTIVWIPLSQGKDDSQAIFESLNDKGMPLTASELLCNYLFRPILDAKESPDQMHDDWWLSSIRLLGDNDNFEEYLRNLFSIGESKMVGKNRKVYVHFKTKHKMLSVASAKGQLAGIRAGVDQYRMILDPIGAPHEDEGITKLLISISQTRMESSTPFVLSVLQAHAANTLSVEKARAILSETTVLLVRRKMAELSTTAYDVMFPQLLSKVINEPNQILALHEQFRKHGVWVSDQEFSAAVETKSAYRTRDLPFARLLLIELDKAFQAFGQFPDYSTVPTIEHVLPQELNGDWLAYLGADASDEHLPQLIHTIGNLCLLSQPANSSAGQNPFTTKIAGYSEVTALARQIKNHPEPWDLAAIRSRSKNLAKAAVERWAWRN